MLESIVEIRKIEIPSTKSLKEDIEKLSETIENTQGPELLKAMKKRLEELKKSLEIHEKRLDEYKRKRNSKFPQTDNNKCLSAVQVDDIHSFDQIKSQKCNIL